ncbi:MAG: pyridoxal-phosphate dependent enzyme, partial [Rhizomicrobium sp.]
MLRQAQHEEVRFCSATDLLILSSSKDEDAPEPASGEAPLFTREEMEQARRQVHAVFHGTPQYRWPLLAERIGTEVWVKHENHTPTGAFKVRGGLIHLERLAR